MTEGPQPLKDNAAALKISAFTDLPLCQRPTTYEPAIPSNLHQNSGYAPAWRLLLPDVSIQTLAAQSKKLVISVDDGIAEFHETYSTRSGLSTAPWKTLKRVSSGSPGAGV